MSESQTVRPVTLGELQAMFPPFVDEVVDGVGMFRFHRLPISSVMKHQERIADSVDDEDGERTVLIDSLLVMVSESLGGEFATADGLAALRTMDLGLQSRLINAAARACGMDQKDRDEKIIALKND